MIRQSTLNLPSAGFENKSPLLIACIANNSVGAVNASATLIIQGEFMFADIFTHTNIIIIMLCIYDCRERTVKSNYYPKLGWQAAAAF